MIKKHVFLAVTFGLICSSAMASFSTVDDFQLNTDLGSIATGSHRDTSGNLYAQGRALGTNGKYSYVVRKSTDGGDSWSTVENFTAFGYGVSAQGELASDSEGAIYGHIRARDSNNDCHWMVRKGASAGTSWSTVDDFEPEGECAVPFGAATDSEDRVYVVGYINHPSNSARMAVRMSDDGGSTWSTVDEFQYASAKRTWAHSVAIDSNDNVYVFGFGKDGTTDKDVWILRKSTNQGASWSTVATYTRDSSQTSQGYAIDITPDGDIYLAGIGYDSNGLERWIVRKSTDGGSTFSTIDDMAPDHFTWPMAIKVNGNDGDIYVGGSRSISADQGSWLVRKSTNGGSTWSDIDDPGSSVLGTHSGVYGLELNSKGEIVSIGLSSAWVANHADPFDIAHWIVRK